MNDSVETRFISFNGRVYAHFGGENYVYDWTDIHTGGSRWARVDDEVLPAGISYDEKTGWATDG